MNHSKMSKHTVLSVFQVNLKPYEVSLTYPEYGYLNRVMCYR